MRGLSIGTLLLVLTGAAAWAQATAELNGRITDESGAVLPGVTVTATQTDTGFTRTAVTDDTGTYVMPNLPTGPYRLEVALQGFRTYIQTGIVLQVGATPTINAVLAVGNLEETVSVEAAAPLVDVRSSGISEVVENERIVELPLQGRQVTDLIVLAGGAVNTGVPNSRNFGGVLISVAGGQNFGVAYVLDGAMHNDPQSNANLPLPFPDALQEFSVATSGLSAQNGVHSGASVNAVTKSGTNALHGNAFDFLRDRRFNATDPFAGLGPDGKRKDDGLLRNQFGGTLGGPIARDRLFFFGGYQGTATRQQPAANLAWVPTASMLAGDFTAFASPACNGGRPIALRAPFVNNRVNPALFSPAALNLVSRLPTATDPCGLITFTRLDNSNEGQAVGKADFQKSGNHSLFGRYMATFVKAPPGYQGGSDNLLKTTDRAGLDNLAQTVTGGDTLVFGSNMVNSFRVAFNRTVVNRYHPDAVDPYDLGAKVYPYSPHEMTISVTGGFVLGVNGTRGRFEANTYQVSDDLSMVRGRHQMSIGVNVALWEYTGLAHPRSGGAWTVNGQATGLGLADLLLGRVSVLEHGGPSLIPIDSWYFGTYAQDTWRLSDRVTINAGLRWEPYFGQEVRNGAVSNFRLDAFRQGVRSTVFHNAPPGFSYPGDAGFPDGRSGLEKQWWNLSPRAGLAWDVNGDGRTAVRASYGIAYDFPSAEYHNINASAPPFGNRSRIEDPPGRMDDPYGHLGGDPHPIVTNADTRYVAYGSFGVVDPEINSPRIQQWNVTYEQQLGSAWAGSASYLGSYSDRLWGQVALNPGQFLGVSPCTLNGVAYPVCTVNANLDQRRVLNHPLIGALDLHTNLGTQSYRGLKLSIRRRAATGVSLSGNYTVSRCFGNSTQGVGFSQISSGYTKPDDPAFDRGHCSQDRTHVATLTVGVQTPQFAARGLRVFASGWRVSGILNARSGSWLNITTGRDNAFNGISAQRPNKVSDDVYGPKTLTNYLNPAAFAQPAPGTYGDLPFNSIQGPGYWTVDLSLSRLLSLGGTHSLELRVEAFNLTNNFNWGNPVTNLGSGQFGRITSGAGPVSTGGSTTNSQRILQFGIKYGF